MLTGHLLLVSTACAMTTRKRTAQIQRKTGETDITIRLDLDGTGVYKNDTGIAFLDHMLDLLSKHALIDLDVKARGDLDVDYHHTRLKMSVWRLARPSMRLSEIERALPVTGGVWFPWTSR